MKAATAHQEMVRFSDDPRAGPHRLPPDYDMALAAPVQGCDVWLNNRCVPGSVRLRESRSTADSACRSATAGGTSG